MAFSAFEGAERKQPRRTSPRGGSAEIGGGQTLVNRRKSAVFAPEYRDRSRCCQARAHNLSLPITGDCASVRRRSPGGHYPGPKDLFMTLPLSCLRPALSVARFPRGAALALIAALALVAAPIARAEDDSVVARVNGTDVKQSDLTLAEEDLGSNIPQMTPEAKKDYLITFCGGMILVAK